MNTKHLLSFKNEIIKISGLPTAIGGLRKISKPSIRTQLRNPTLKSAPGLREVKNPIIKQRDTAEHSIGVQ